MVPNRGPLGGEAGVSMPWNKTYTIQRKSPVGVVDLRESVVFSRWTLEDGELYACRPSDGAKIRGLASRKTIPREKVSAGDRGTGTPIRTHDANHLTKGALSSRIAPNSPSSLRIKNRSYCSARRATPFGYVSCLRSLR
jgi:hypothetical protein